MPDTKRKSLYDLAKETLSERHSIVELATGAVAAHLWELWRVRQWPPEREIYEEYCQQIWHQKSKSSFCWSVDWNPDGVRLATANDTGVVCVFDMDDGEEASRIVQGDITNWVRTVSWDPSGELLATAGADGLIRVIDGSAQTRAQWPEQYRLKQDRPIYSVGWSTDGQRLAAGGQDCMLRVYNLAAYGREETKGKRNRLRLEELQLQHGGPIFGVHWNPTSSLVATACNDKGARGFDTRSGKEEIFFLHTGPVLSVAWDPTGVKMATGSDDGYARVFDVRMGLEDDKLQHGGAVNIVAWRQDGRKLATGCNDQQCTIIDVNTFQPELKMNHGTRVNSVAWRPQG